MRALNRLGAVLAGLALIGTGGFIALETILAATGQPFVVIPVGRWLRVLRHTPWSATTVIVVMAAISAAGLLLVLAEGRRWRLAQVPLSMNYEGTAWWVTRRSLEAHLSRQLQAGTAALGPRSRIEARTHHWRIKVVTRTPDTASASVVCEQIESEAGQILARLGVSDPIRIKVRIRPGPAARRTAGGTPSGTAGGTAGGAMLPGQDPVAP